MTENQTPAEVGGRSVITNLTDIEARLVPFVAEDGVTTIGEVSEVLVRNEKAVTVSCGIWRTGPTDWSSTMRAAETLLVLSGSATVCLEGGLAMEIRTGGVVNVPPGIEIRIVVNESLTTFFTLVLHD